MFPYIMECREGCRVKIKYPTWLRTLRGRSVLFTLTMLLVVLLVAGSVTEYSQKVLREEIVARNTAQTIAAVEQLGVSLDKAVNLQRELLYDEDVNRLGVIPGYYSAAQKTRAMLRVQNRLFMLTSSSTLIKEAYFLAPSIGKSITSSSVDILSEARFAQANQLCISQTQALTAFEDEFYLMMAYPVYNSYLEDNGASYLLCLQLDRQMIAEFLSAHGAVEGDALFLFSSDGQLVASANYTDLSFDTDNLFYMAEKQSAFEVTTEKNGHYLASSAQNTTAGKVLTLVKLQPHDRAFSVLNLQGGFFTGLILMIILANLAYIVHMWHVIHKPLRKLSHAFAKVEQGDFDLYLHHDRDDDFSEMFQQFNRMNQRLGELIEQVYMQTIRTQRAELKQLQSQINPHFLYNNLFTLRSLAQLGDTETIEVMASELGEYFRYVTRLGKQEVTLAEEVEHARHFASIQDMRFSNRIHLVFPPLPPCMAEAVVPRLILQPLVENAYQHGLEQISGKGELHIGYQMDGADILITVEDSGAGMTQDMIDQLQARMSNPDVEETTGLINIHRRLKLRFGKAYGLRFELSELGGLRVIMRVPLKGSENFDAQSPDR